MFVKKIKVIIDYDGTLTHEEKYVTELASNAIKDLAENILKEPPDKIKKIYKKTKEKVLNAPEKYSFIVNGEAACYAGEGALLVNTAIIYPLFFEKRQNRF